MPALNLGSNRIVYKATDFKAGVAVTAHLWSPSLAKSELQMFTELEEGLYYLDHDFAEAGSWPLIVYENGVAKGFSVMRVEVVEGTITLPAAVRLLLATLVGKLSGAGSTTIRFRDLEDTKDRIVATVDAVGNRSVMELDAS